MFKKLLLLSAMAAPAFGATWFTYSGHEYSITDSYGSWTSMEAQAEGYGATLAIIDSAAEESFINSTFGTSQWWIGFTDQDVEGSFEWIDGSPVTYTNWAGGEPNNAGGEDYTVMNWSGVAWNDLPDWVERWGIMERDLGHPVPEVHTFGTLLGAALIGANVLKRRRKAS